MRRYKVKYFSGDRSKPDCITQISKSRRWDGTRIRFWSDVRKGWQGKYKNGLLNGIYKDWWWYNNPKNTHFINWKKGNGQGIRIKFK